MTQEAPILSPLQEGLICEILDSVEPFALASFDNDVTDPGRVMAAALSSGFSMAVALAVYEPEFWAANFAGFADPGNEYSKDMARQMREHIQSHIDAPTDSKDCTFEDA